MDPGLHHHEYEGARHEVLYETAEVRADPLRRIDRFRRYAKSA